MIVIRDNYSILGIELSSGRALSLNKGLLSISDDMKCGEGYDSPLWLGYRDENFEIINELTETERDEIADYMISLWERFRKEGCKSWG